MDVSSLFNVKGKIVLVTGGAKGIGRMISEGFVTNGATVYISSRDASSCEQACKELNGLGRGKAIAIPADFYKEADVKKLAEEFGKRESKLHVLVNNSGSNWGAPYDEYPESAWTRVLTLNLQRVFTVTQLMTKYLEAAASAEDPSRVINIGSVDGIRVPELETFAYSSSKAGVHHLTKVLANHLGRKNITISRHKKGGIQEGAGQKLELVIACLEWFATKGLHGANLVGLPFVIHRAASSVPFDLGGRGGAGQPPTGLPDWLAVGVPFTLASQLASHLDLNTLHNLSLTCRQFRANLLQFRSQLVKQTLHCANEDVQIGSRLAERLRESHQTWQTGQVGRITSGKVGHCARDMVGECRKCGKVVCRNCIMKPPPRNTLNGRLRRLCKTCTRVPLWYHTRLRGSWSDSAPATFTESAYARGPCTCVDAGVWLCNTCGQSLRVDDVAYLRGWSWRTRYSNYLGGLGTGIGEGNEGVECGLGEHCFAAREVEQEIECDADELAALECEAKQAGLEGREWRGTSYLFQEIEGIGGAVKKKVKKRVRLGAVVKEYEDEREHSDHLRRERDGSARCWCSWCARVLPGRKDVDGSMDRATPSRPDSSSSIASEERDIKN
ncbi:MAG: hypothetical protein Q9165_006363 [Trypethelium subeluteriae]